MWLTFYRRASIDKSLTLRHLTRIGLQDGSSRQEEEIYVFNPEVALKFNHETKSFQTVPLPEAGFYGKSLLPDLKKYHVTVCRDEPRENFPGYIRGEIGDVHFVTLACLWGKTCCLI